LRELLGRHALRRAEQQAGRGQRPAAEVERRAEVEQHRAIASVDPTGGSTPRPPPGAPRVPPPPLPSVGPPRAPPLRPPRVRPRGWSRRGPHPPSPSGRAAHWTP